MPNELEIGIVQLLKLNGVTSLKSVFIKETNPPWKVTDSCFIDMELMHWRKTLSGWHLRAFFLKAFSRIFFSGSKQHISFTPNTRQNSLNFAGRSTWYDQIYLNIQIFCCRNRWPAFLRSDFATSLLMFVTDYSSVVSQTFVAFLLQPLVSP